MNISRREMLAGLLATWAVGSIPLRLLGETQTAVQYKPTDTGPGRKFGFAGVAQRFPGNTVLCHLNQPGRQFEVLQQAIAGLRARAGDANITWLPPSSYHMTVFDGALDSRRQPNDWPAALPLGASLKACDDFVAERLKDFDLGFDPPIRMVADESQRAPTQTCIPLRPLDALENRRLRDLRDRMAAALGVHHPKHEDYTFHISFGYYIRAFNPAAEKIYRADLLDTIQALRRQLPVIEMGAPEYCLFDDMMAFHTQFYLKHRGHA